MHHLIDRTQHSASPRWDVVGETNELFGRVAQTRGGRHERPFYAALGPDRCDMGRHPNIKIATDAIVADAAAGWLRSPRNSTERYRELYDGPREPIYPIGAGTGVSLATS
jgi:hypothetical protein